MNALKNNGLIFNAKVEAGKYLQMFYQIPDYLRKNPLLQIS